MRRLLIALVAATAACGGRAPAPAPVTPASRAPAVSGDPASLRYAMGPGRYRFESALHTEQEVMGSTSSFDLNTSLLVSTVMGEEGGNISLVITVDSATVSGNAPGVDAAMFSAALGRTFRALFTPAGRPISVTTPDSTNPIFVQLGRGFREFVPLLPPMAITAGAAWSDTLNQVVPNPGGEGTTAVTSRRQHRVVGWETREGQRVLHLATAASLTLSGTGEIQGQPIELTGTGTSAIDRYVTAGGAYLGAAQADTTNLTVNVLSVGVTVPVRQAQRTTVTRLP